MKLSISRHKFVKEQGTYRHLSAKAHNLSFKEILYLFNNYTNCQNI